MVALPTLALEVGFTAGAGTSNYLHLDDVARGILDTNTLAPDDLFTDVTAYLHNVTTQRTSSRLAGPVLRYEAGKLTATLDNTDRRFDPTNLAGPYVSGGRSQVQPMRVVRLRATWAGITYDVWRGFADAWLPAYLKGDRYAGIGLTATDGFKVLGNNDRAPASAAGAGEDTGARVTRILNSASWPVADRVIVAGDTTVQATTLEGDALAELMVVTETEIGEFYMDHAGRAFFRNRNGVNEDTRSNTSQATFGDAGAELRYFEIEPSTDPDQLVNRARITRVGGVEQTAEDTASITEFLIAAHKSSSLLMQTDAAALDYAGYLVATSKEPEYRFESLVINPLRDPANLFPQVLGRQFGDRITVRRRPPGGGTIEQDVLIRGITHAIDGHNGTWLTTWQLQSASKTAFLVLDHATLGKLDANALSY
jgi:hypothetical protein